MEELHELCVWYGRIHAEWMAFVYAVSPSVSVDEGECAYDTFFCIIFSLHDPNIWMQQSELSTLSYGTLWTFMYQQNLAMSAGAPMEESSSGVHFNEWHTPSSLGRVDPYTLEYRKDKSFSCVSELLFYIDQTHFQCANVYGNGYQSADPHQEKGAYVLRIPYSQLSK
jgi:hypothetical protein